MNYFSFQWHITEKCDQRCKHCYIYSNDGHIALNETPLEMFPVVINACEDLCKYLNRKPYFSITGGDPILNKDFWSLIELLSAKGIPFSILGNPFHLTDRICRDLKRMGCQKYQLSLDGLRTTHDIIRKPGSFDETISKIPMLNEAGLISTIMTTISISNIDEIPSLIDVVVENKARVFSFARYCPTTNDRSLLVSPKRYRDLLDKCWSKFKYYKDQDTSFNLKDHLWTLYLYEEGYFKIDPALDEDTIYDGCNCAINHLTILSDGTVLACRRMNSPVGNIYKQSMISIFESQELDSYRKFESFVKCSKCELLRFCRGCPATGFAINGNNMYGADPQCWKEFV